MYRFKYIILGLLFSLSLLSAETHKAVFDLTTGDAVKIEKHLINNMEVIAKYYKAHHQKFKTAVVISGNAYKYFVKDIAHSPYRNDRALLATQRRLAPLLQKLHDAYGVQFTMCQNGMKARKINPKVLYGYVESEMNKSLYLIYWQNEGYAYLPIH